MRHHSISAVDLRLLLSLHPFLEQECTEGRRRQFAAPEEIGPAWNHYYEQSFAEHLLGVMAGLPEGGSGAGPRPAVNVSACPAGHGVRGPVEPLPQLSRTANFGPAFSLIQTFRARLIFGAYLNELITQVRGGGRDADKALLRAVKIDPTVLGCPSVGRRVSQAVMLDDKPFLRRLRTAMNGRLTRRQLRGYQQMQLVLQVLHEANAPGLGEDDLYRLFNVAMKLVAKESARDAGQLATRLRQLTSQFMRQQAAG